MTGKAAKKSKDGFPRKNVVVFKGDTEEESARNYASLAISPELAAYRVIVQVEEKSGIGAELDTPALIEQLKAQAKAVTDGSMEQAEAMLMNQAITLQSLFSRLASRGMAQENATPFELNMRMALRAQAQCRATLEALSHIKNPPIYTTQVNATTGPQQINNGASSTERRGSENGQTQLLESIDEQRMDTGAASKASTGDKTLEAVGEIDGPKDGRGQG